MEDPVENALKKKISPKSRNRIPSICSSIEQLTLAVEEVCLLMSKSLVDHIRITQSVDWQSQGFLFCTVSRLAL
jgi:hypothetical protein